MIKEGQIVYCNLTFKNKKGERTIVKEQIIGRDYDSQLKIFYDIANQDDLKKLTKWGLKESVTLVKVDLIKDMGMKQRVDAGYKIIKQK